MALMGKTKRLAPGFRILFLVLGFLLLFILLSAFFLRILPYAGDQALEELAFSLSILDRKGTELAILPVNQEGLRRLFLPLEEIPEDLVRIVLAAEDRRFYFHPGVDPFSLFSAVWDYLNENSMRRGASTLSMQLSSMLHPRPATPGGKAQEIIDAMQLETRLGKKGILELYLNLVPMGFNVEGYPAAARRFFGKDLKDLDAVELAVLAAVPRSPANFNPIEKREQAIASARSILNAAGMRDLAGDMDVISIQALASWPLRAAHFVNYLKLSGHLNGEDGRQPYVSSLDMDIQAQLEAILMESVHKASEYRISNAAGIFADPQTGEILAYAGSVDFYDQAEGQIDGVQMRRQPGSTLKPFLSALALENGFSLSSILPDIEMSFGSGAAYSPRNFNDQFNGPVRLRQALASSLNLPAVYLIERLSVQSFVDSLLKAGFLSLEGQRDQLGVSLAVGGAEVSLYELLAAFLSFYSDGSRPPLSPRLAGNAGGPESDRIQVWDPTTAALIRTVLTDKDERIMTFGRSSHLNYDFPVMVKTGTSNQFNNIWAVAVAKDIAGAIWMGNFGGQTVQAAPGSSLPAAALRPIIEAQAQRSDFDKNSQLRSLKICSLSGMRAGEHCPHTISEFYAPNSLPELCDWHPPELRGQAIYPQIYGFWAEDYGYRINLRDTGPVEIWGIMNRGIYYIDPLRPLDAQQALVYFTGEGSGKIRLDGTLIYDGSLPARIPLAMIPGQHHLELESGSRQVLRTYAVY